MTAHDRFRRIEARRAEDASEVHSADRARIVAVIDAAPASASPESLELEDAAPRSDLEARGVTSQVLDDASTQPQVDLALDTESISGQPFVRCARCGADSGVHAKACDSCGAELDTAEQRTFNEKVWEARLRRDERERAALAQMAEARAENVRATARALPEPGLKPPPELLDPIEDHGKPVLLEALVALQKPKWQWTAAAIVAGLPIVLVALGGPFFPKLGGAFAFLCALGLLPRQFVKRLLQKRADRRRPH